MSSIENGSLRVTSFLQADELIKTPKILGDSSGTLSIGANTLEVTSSASAELKFVGDATTNIVSEKNLTLLAGNGDTDTDDILTLGSAGEFSQVVLKNGCLGIGTNVFQAVGTKQLSIANGTSPGALTADQIYIGAKDSAGTGTDTLSTLQLFLEEDIDATALDAVGTLTTRIPIWVNDICYWLYLDPV